MSKKQYHSYGKSICRAHFMRIVSSDILHWYKIFGDKAYLRKENSSVLLLKWKTYNQCFKMIVKLSDQNFLQKVTEKLISKILIPFLYKAITCILGLKIY